MQGLKRDPLPLRVLCRSGAALALATCPLPGICTVHTRTRVHRCFNATLHERWTRVPGGVPTWFLAQGT